MKLIYCYLLLIIAVGFVLMLTDKFRAQNKMRRTPEAVLLGCALIGGSVGCLLGMYAVRHKTKHFTFTIGIPLILVGQILIFFMLK